jgi:hypothetical protein
MTLPAHTQREVRRILDGAARRLLADQLDADTPGATAGHDPDGADRRPDQRSPLVQGEPVPVRRRAHDDNRPLAA